LPFLVWWPTVMNSPDLLMNAPCPKCSHEMIYVTALPYPKAPRMRRTTFLCHSCNRTRSYMLSPEMAERYRSTSVEETSAAS
jgi:transposase-like protein